VGSRDKQIDRVVIEVAANMDPATKAFQDAVKVVDDGVSKISANMKRMVTAQENALNPTIKLGDTIEAMTKSGWACADMYSVLKERIEKTTSVAAANKQTIDPHVAALKQWGDSVYQTAGAMTQLGSVLKSEIEQKSTTAAHSVMAFATALGPVATTVTLVAAGAIAAGAAVGKLAEHLSDEVIELRNHAMATGHTIQEYQSLNRIGAELGVNTDMLARQFGMLERQMATGTKMEFVKVLNALRLANNETAADISKGVVHVIDDLGKRTAELGSAQERSAVMNSAFNRRLMDTGVIMLNTRGHLEDYMKEVEKQIGFSDDYVKSMIETHNALALMGRAWEGAKNKMSEFFAAFMTSEYLPFKAFFEWLQTFSGYIPPPVQPQNVGATKHKGGGYGIGGDWGSTDRNATGGYGVTESWGEEAVDPEKARKAMALQKLMEERAKIIMQGLLDTTEATKAAQAAFEQYIKAFNKGETEEARYWLGKWTMFQNYSTALESGMQALANAKEKFQEAETQGNWKGELQWAREVFRIQQMLDEIKKAPKDFEGYIKTLKEVEQINDSIAQKGKEALGGNLLKTQDTALRNTTEWATKALKDRMAFEVILGRDVTRSKLEELKLEQQITNQVIPRNDYERVAIEEHKTFLEEAIRAEEIRTKFAQRRADLEKIIAATQAIPIVGPGFAELLRAQMGKLDQQMQEELNVGVRLRMAQILRIHQQEYKRMIDVYKSYAGELFDAIFESGKKGFGAILDWLQSTFKNLLKQIFMNIMAGALQGSGLYQMFRDMVQGSYPQGGPNTAAGSNMMSDITSAVKEGVSPLTRLFTGKKWSPATQEWIPDNYVMAPEYAGAAVGMGVPGIGVLQPQYLPQSQQGASGSFLSGINWGTTLAGLGLSAGAMMAIDGIKKKSTWESVLGGGMAGAGLGFMLSGGTGLGAAAGGVMGAGAMLAISGIRGHGVGSWAETIGGGFLVAGPAGAFVASVIKLATQSSKSTKYAGSVEAQRDLGVNFSEDQFKQLYEGYGLNADLAYGMRKEITFAPKSLQQMGALAKQQGTYDEFLGKLEKVETSWGTFNFRDAYEIGDLTGDWTKLDKAFTDAFKSSKVLQENLPNWKEVLTVNGDAVKKLAGEFEGLYQSVMQTGVWTQELTDFLKTNKDALDEAAQSSNAFAKELAMARASAEKFTELEPMITGFTGLRDSMQNAIVPTKTMYDTFLETGKILPELADQIVEYGGDLSKFQALSDIASLNDQFQTMVQHFRDTGEILPALRDLVQKYGGDLSALDAASDLPNLMKGLAAIKELASGISGLQKTPVESILNGDWSPAVENALRGMGLDPARLQGIAQLIKIEKGWDQAVQDFQTKMKFEWNDAYQKWVSVPVGLEPGGVLETALKKYGGAEGLAAISNYAKGFNTVTPDLLKATKSAADLAYENEITSSLAYLGQAETETNDKITTLTNGVLAQFDIASNGIMEEIAAAKDAVVEQLKLIVSALNKVVIDAGTAAGANFNPNPATNETAPAPSPSNPKYTDENGVPIQQPVLPRGGTETAYARPLIIVEGPIYGYDEFSAKVETAAIMLRRRGSPAFSTS
jgi:hypothetical protein